MNTGWTHEQGDAWIKHDGYPIIPATTLALELLPRAVAENWAVERFRQEMERRTG